MKLSEHFDSSEFECSCGCGRNEVSMELIGKLENLHDLMGAKAIIVTSGFRCPTHSVRVGGYSNDAHTRGIAADIKVQKPDGSWYDAYDIAEAAERIGFTGIGVMNGACHVDIRNSSNYTNSHWFGDETTGNNYISTFQRGTSFPSRTSIPSATSTGRKRIKIEVDGEIILDKEI